VWNSQDTQSQSQVALWYPSLSVSMMSSTKVSSRCSGKREGGMCLCIVWRVCAYDVISRICSVRLCVCVVTCQSRFFASRGDCE
jgi:hypothetical protein